MGFLDRGIEIKTPEQIDGHARGRPGRRRDPRAAAVRRSAPAITTGELDAIAEDNIRSSGATPSFKGYHGFPGSICASVNDEVVHGIPGDRVLAEGDVISIDCGAIVDGWHGDAAITVAVGDVPAEVTELMAVTEEAMWRGIAAARLGGRVTDISHAVETHLRLPRQLRHPRGLRRPRHRLRDAPAAQRAQLRPARPRPEAGPGPGAGRRADGHPRRQGHALVLDDDWTVVTDDGSWAAHFEHTFTLTPDGAWVLTALDGGEADARPSSASRSVGR